MVYDPNAPDTPDNVMGISDKIAAGGSQSIIQAAEQATARAAEARVNPTEAPDLGAGAGVADGTGAGDSGLQQAIRMNRLSARLQSNAMGYGRYGSMQGDRWRNTGRQESIADTYWGNWRGGQGQGFQMPISRKAWGHTPEAISRFGRQRGAESSMGSFPNAYGGRMNFANAAQRAWHPMWGGGTQRDFNFLREDPVGGIERYRPPEIPFSQFPYSQQWNPFEQFRLPDEYGSNW